MSLARRAVLSLIEPSSGDLIPKDKLKARLRIDDDLDDPALDGIIAAVIGYMDGPNGVLGRCLVTQTWDEKFEGFPGLRKPLELALSPMSEVVNVRYFDPDGIEQTLAAEKFEAASDGDLALINAFDGWPATDPRRMFPVTVRYRAGFGAVDAVPPPLVEALMQHAGTLYERREALGVTGIDATPLGYDDLIFAYRRPSL